MVRRLSSNLIVSLVTRCIRWSFRALERLAGLCALRPSLLRVLPVMVFSALAASCTTTPTPPPRPGAWLVFLCQASDNTSEPQTVAFYQELFDPNRQDLVTGFFRTMSNGAVDLSGTEVYGWFKMTVNTSALTIARRNINTHPGRNDTAQDCKSAGVAAFLASGKTIDPARYNGFIAVVNVPVDAGMAGPSVVANFFEPASFYQHEMLHVLGLGHSNRMSNDTSADHVWEAGLDEAYEDPWDIMSYRKFIFENAVAGHDITGPELQIAYRQKMGWVPAARVLTVDTADPLPTTLTLVPVSEASRPGLLMARVDLAGMNGSYVVEYRINTGFDLGAPGSAVVIRELRRNGQTYLVSRLGAVPPYRTITMSGFVVGEEFTDSANFLSIRVDAMTALSATITINPRSRPLIAGDVCGNSGDHGVFRSCPTGTSCSPRSSTSCSGWWIFRTCTTLHTTDLFCQ